MGEAEAAAEAQAPRRTLSLLRVVALLMAGCSAGPYGFEECVGSGGAGLTILGLLTVPFVWSLPLALVTAELSTAIPENGGHIVWVDRALGSFWSYQNSFLSFVGNVFECAVYPAMFVDYLGKLYGREFETSERFTLCLLAVSFFLLVNVRGGSTSVGDVSMAISVVGLTPFLLMIIVGAPSVSTAHVFQRTADFGAVNWRSFLTILLWNTSGYDFVGAIAGEVKNPTLTIPSALAVTLLGTIAIDTLAVVVGVSVETDHKAWSDGHFMVCGLRLGGIPLQTAFVLGATVSTLGLLCSMMLTTSWFLAGMAKCGTAPKIFAQIHETYSTPWVAMTFNAAFIAAATVLDFGAIAELEMWLYCASTVLKFAAFFVLRYREKTLERPFKVPLASRGALAVFIACPIALCMLLMTLARVRTQIVGVGVMVLAAIVYRSVPPLERSLPVALEMIAD